MAYIEYSSNNSGGNWWLTDDDWRNLEKAGWKVFWTNNEFVYDSRGNHVIGPDGMPVFRSSVPGDLRYSEDGRWLGSIAKYAFRAGLTEEQAKAEFSKITGQDTEEPGCHCCGQPHNFFEFEN